MSSDGFFEFWSCLGRIRHYAIVWVVFGTIHIVQVGIGTFPIEWVGSDRIVIKEEYKGTVNPLLVLYYYSTKRATRICDRREREIFKSLRPKSQPSIRFSLSQSPLPTPPKSRSIFPSLVCSISHFRISKPPNSFRDRLGFTDSEFVKNLIGDFDFTH